MNAVEVTEFVLNDLIKGTVAKSQYPKIKKHVLTFDTFSLIFGLVSVKLLKNI